MTRYRQATREEARVAAARQLMWDASRTRACVDCGTENPHEAPCCGVCGGDLESDKPDTETSHD